MNMNIGDVVPDLTFVKPDGSARALADFAGRRLLIVFLRHLA